MFYSMYVGRFAPSPTGPLHLGSLLAALASFLEARSRDGKWLLRIDDIDPPREQPGATQGILATLSAHGFNWDGDVLLQSTRCEAYRKTIKTLALNNLVYPCTCSRKKIKLRTSASHYDRFCLEYPPAHSAEAATRFLNHTSDVRWSDAIQGPQLFSNTEVGDFILQRRDALWAYHLAVTVDDNAQGITHVVRGFDLLAESAKQIALCSALQIEPPAFTHIPVALSPSGQKLSKQNLAPALDNSSASVNLIKALDLLGQQPEPSLVKSPPEEILAWATKHWQLDRVARAPDFGPAEET
ncbi:MAG: tRNA glutamyl-Q(34) synthetase GluQRS [Pseudomonadales bacterium]